MRVDAVPLGFTTGYLLRDRGTVLVEAGMRGVAGRFRRRLRQLGVEPAEVSLVVITHAHFDHAGSANEIRAITGAKIAVHRLDRFALKAGKLAVPPGTTRWGRLSLHLLRLIFGRDGGFPPVRADVALEDDVVSLAEFGVPARVVHTPGHTAGSVSVLLDSGEAFVGDLAMNKLPLTVRPSLPIYAEDIEAVKRSWRHLLDLGVRRVYPAHGRPFPVEKLRAALG